MKEANLLRREEILRGAGAENEVLSEVLIYNENHFNIPSHSEGAVVFPLPDEPFLSAWEEYAAAGEKTGIYEVLQKKLVQLNFPVQTGMSSNANYLAATRKGEPTPDMAEAAGLSLERPEAVELRLHQTPAGKLPLLIVRHRPDFVALIQALALRNEPREIPASMGALMLVGYNNWDRVRAYRREWEETEPQATAEKWKEEFSRLIGQKERYQDRFIILSDGPYSAVAADALGLAPQQWQDASLAIRREHECAHYFTRRVFNSMRNNALDEIIADFMGILAACGRYRAAWFLHFSGLESFPTYRKGGRLENYAKDLSPAAFQVLTLLVYRAATHLEQFSDQCLPDLVTPKGKIAVLFTICSLTLEEMAGAGAAQLMSELFAKHMASL